MTSLRQLSTIFAHLERSLTARREPPQPGPEGAGRADQIDRTRLIKALRRNRRW